MLDEEKVVDAEVVDAEPVKEEAPVATRPAEDDKVRNALAAFIMSLIGLVLVGSPGGNIAAIILGAIAGKKARLAEGVTRNPHRVFNKIAKPVSIVDIILGILSIIGWTIGLICYVVVVVLGVVESGMGA